jgi:hypothetical protein
VVIPHTVRRDQIAQVLVSQLIPHTGEASDLLSSEDISSMNVAPTH